MKFTRSIRWRLQVWHGVMLLAALAGFGTTAHRLHEAMAWRRVDQELQKRLGVVHESLRRRPDGPPPGMGLDEDRPRGGRPEDPLAGPPMPRSFRLIPGRASLFESESNAYYFVVWLRDGRLLAHSDNAPVTNPLPPRVSPPLMGATIRFHDGFREWYEFTPPGECLLVGQSVAAEQASLNQLALGLTAFGVTVLGVGLVGGAWLAARAIRPIHDISVAAGQIAMGDLSRRIDTAETDNELGRLATILNTAFARLEGAVQQQAQFAADASHELRTPITVILTQTQLALSRTRDAEEYRATLEACQRSATRMRGLIDSLLTLARLDAAQPLVNPEKIRLDVLVQESVDSLQLLAKQRGIQVLTELIPVTCPGDPERLSQVAINLISNAILHNNQREGGEVRIRLETRDGFALWTLSDNGPGIPPEHQTKVFERFYRIDASRSAGTGGSGLGLAIVKAIVEAHGGSVGIGPMTDSGCQIFVRLPIVPAD